MENKGILAVCPGHNSSVTLIVNDRVEFYLEEERLTKIKYDHDPYKTISYVLSEFKNVEITDFCVVGTSENMNDYIHLFNFFSKLIRKDDVGFWYWGIDHHKMHAACAFYNSGFDSALAFIIDGAGSYKRLTNNNAGWQTESVLICKKPNTFEYLNENLGCNYLNNEQDNYFQDNPLSVESQHISLYDDCGIVKAYEGITDFLGFHFIDAGKTMGLSSYGKPNEKFKDLFIDKRGNRKYFRPMYPAGSKVISKHLIEYKADKSWHKNPNLVNSVMKDVSYELQQQSQSALLNLILEKIKIYSTKNIVLAGGYGLNCVSNYFLRKNLPKDYNLYVEPISHDGGTSMGAAKLIWHLKNEDLKNNNFKQNSIYYGPSYSLDDIEKALINCSDKFDVKENIIYSDIVDLLLKENMICMFQGRSEAGPRALGNRSILFDPRVKDGKDKVNLVKKREWFRPFAGSVLLEKASQWFDMAGLEESPYMMYAVDVLENKAENIPSITHVDNTCRVQTVTKTQNLHFYNLIEEFDKQTGIPILFNTSFNLAGEPLVETIEDALSTLERSDLEYLYLPEYNKLVCKKIIDS